MTPSNALQARATAVVEQLLVDARARLAEQVNAEFAAPLQRLTAAGAVKRRGKQPSPLAQLRSAMRAAIAAGTPTAEEAALSELLAKASPQLPLNRAALPAVHLDINGNELPDGVTSGHVMTKFPAAGLIFDVRPWRTVTGIAAAREHAASIDLLGRKGHWTVGEDYEAELIIDRDFHSPAVNRAHFPNAPDSGWVLTNRPHKGSPGCVWFVSLYHGNVNWYLAGDGGLVVPVLRVPPSQ